MNTKIHRILYFYLIFRTMEQKYSTHSKQTNTKNVKCNIVLLKPVSVHHVKDVP